MQNFSYPKIPQFDDVISGQKYILRLQIWNRRQSYWYRNGTKFSDGEALANSVDPGQIKRTGLGKQCRPRSDRTDRSWQIDCSCIFSVHYSMVKPHCSNCGIIWARSCENVSYAICEQQWCRSACTDIYPKFHDFT